MNAISMNDQLISTAIGDKSVMLHTTGQDDATSHVFTSAGHIWLGSCENSSAVLKWQVLRVGSVINHNKSAVVLSETEHSFLLLFQRVQLVNCDEHDL